jgi:hypothetical protein
MTSATEARDAAWPSRLAPFVAALLATGFALQGLLASRDESPTWDEPGYVAAGWLNLVQGDYRLNADHPPLLQKASALPLLLLDVKAPPVDDPRFLESENPRATYGRAFFYDSGNDALLMMQLARLPVLLLGALLVLCVFAFTRSLFGSGPALVACALAALCPSLAAHGRLATEDLGCAAGMYAATFALWRCVERPAPWRALVCGVATGLALLTKYTALLLVPIFACLALFAWRCRRERVSGAELAGILSAVAGVAFVVVSLGYGATFRPDLYLRGVFRIYPDVAQNYSFYLLGRVSETPFWYHAPVSLAIKTPLPALALVAIAALRARGAARADRLAFLLVPPAVVLAAACFDITSPGIRRILPALPFLLSFAGLAAARPCPRWLGALVIALLAGSTAVAVRSYPFQLAYLNAAAGGSEAGPRVTDESNVDWGQELPRLAAWQRAQMNPGEALRLFYFGSAVPEVYGVLAEPFDLADAARPRRGTYAISAHYLAWFRKLEALEGADVDWLDKYEPVARIGHSIYVYRFEQDAPAPAASGPASLP